MAAAPAPVVVPRMHEAGVACRGWRVSAQGLSAAWACPPSTTARLDRRRTWWRSSATPAVAAGVTFPRHLRHVRPAHQRDPPRQGSEWRRRRRGEEEGGRGHQVRRLDGGGWQDRTVENWRSAVTRRTCARAACEGTASAGSASAASTSITSIV